MTKIKIKMSKMTIKKAENYKEYQITVIYRGENFHTHCNIEQLLKCC